MAEADDEFECVEAVTSKRVRLALDMLYHEQQSYGACSHAV